MIKSVSNPPGGASRLSFYVFLLIAPAGLLFILAIILASQYKQFKSIVTPSADVTKFNWDDSAQSRLDALSNEFHTFVAPGGAEKMDSLWITAADLDLILAFSPVAASQGMRFHVEIGDSLITVHTTQPVQSLQGRFAWIFKRLAANHLGYLNARLDGRPQLKDGKLDFAPEEGFLNGQKVPAVALIKRGGMSPLDFMAHHEFYDEFVQVLAEAKVAQGKILFVRKP